MKIEVKIYDPGLGNSNEKLIVRADLLRWLTVNSYAIQYLEQLRRSVCHNLFFLRDVLQFLRIFQMKNGMTGAGSLATA